MSIDATATTSRRTVLVTHGAWSAGWVWKKMRPRLAAHDIDLWTPTYTGVGERTHLAHPDITLSDHIADVVAVIEYENLTDITLVSHSYGGMVGTGVCDAVPGEPGVEECNGLDDDCNGVVDDPPECAP